MRPSERRKPVWVGDNIIRVAALHYRDFQRGISLFAEAKVVDITGKHPSQRSTPGVVMTFGMGDMSQLGYVATRLYHPRDLPFRSSRCKPRLFVSFRYESEGRKKPKIVPELEDTDIVAVECGGMHTAVVTKDGKVRDYPGP